MPSPVRSALALVVALLALLAPATASAQAPNTIGALSNFDVFNTTGELTHGFEIELDGLTSADISYTFGGSYLRYGTPQIVDFPGGVYIRYQSPYDPATHSFVEATQLASQPITATDGHSCFEGAIGNYATSGCEHFGVGTVGNPTATVYRWLVADPATPGSLIRSGTQVSIPAPVWNVIPAAPGAPNQAPVVGAVIAAPEPPAAWEFGEALWVKVYVTETETEVDLEHLLTDDPAVPQSETEIEWMLLQVDRNTDNSGELGQEQQLAEGNVAITRRYEFFEYTGPYDPETHEALVVSDSNPSEGEVGNYLGAQMAALNVDPGAWIRVSASPLAEATVGSPYSATLFTGGVGAYSATTTAGAVPEGLTVGADGTISGTPTTAGTSTFTVDVTDEAGTTTSGAFELTVTGAPPPAIVVSPGTLDDGEAGTAYSATLFSGGTPPFVPTVTAGALPDGLTVDADGTLGGTPSAAGTSTFTVDVTDAAGQTASGAFQLTVTSPPPAIIVGASGLAGGEVGVAYSATLFSGGTAPFSRSVTAGAVPAGLTITADGRLTGTPTAAGSSSFTVGVTDAAAQTAAGSFSVTIAGRVAIATQSLPVAKRKRAYRASLAAAGGRTPYAWALTAGTLPAGLAFDPATGAISGVPTQRADASLTFRVTDGLGAAATEVLVLKVK